MTEHVEWTLDAPPSPTDLTIAICTIGRDGYLQAAIQSLLDTTPPGVELRIVLNCPDDPTLRHRLDSLLIQWNGPVTISVLDERLTISASHNAALDAVTTKFVTFMGDDDLALEPRVEQLLGLFWTVTPTPAVVGSFCRRVSGTHDAPRFSTNKDYGPTTIEEWKLERDSGELIEIVFPSAIYRTDLLRSIGGFEERFGSAMDLATFTVLAQHHPVIADPRRTFAHRIHDGSVTSSSASEHAARLRYTAACMAAVRNGASQPTWNEFVALKDKASLASRAAEQRHTMSAILFRQGGAAVVSGSRLQGFSKIAASAAVSPTTFFGRFRSQVTRESTAEPVVSFLLKSIRAEQTDFYELLRTELRNRHVELRLVVAEHGEAEPLGWAEYRAPHKSSGSTKGGVWRPGVDVATTSELIVTEYGDQHRLSTALTVGQGALRTRHCVWGDGDVYPLPMAGQPGESHLRRLTQNAHWFIACSDPMVNAVVAAGMASDRITVLGTTAELDPVTMASQFATGLLAALEAPPR